MKKFLRIYLATLAKILIKIKKPYIIGVTGSAGKTTISKFVVQYLEAEFGKNSVDYSRHNYNWEFGLPLTIIGAKTGGKNIIKWMWVFFVFLKKIFTKTPKFLVLEYGIDTIGEMDFLVSIATPDIAIISRIVPNHMEQFRTEENYRNEKLKICAAKKIFAHKSLEKFFTQENLTKTHFFDISDTMWEIFAKNISTQKYGVSADIIYKNQEISVQLPMFGEYQIENIFPLIFLADELERNPKNLENFSKNFSVESGRSGIFQGKNNAIVIDGTYNGGLLSMIESLESIKKITKNEEIILLLGDMRELWEFEKKSHEELATKILENFSKNFSIKIFLIGKVMREIVFPILKEKFDITSELSSRIAGEKIAQILEKNPEKEYIIFAKWSQNTIFLEEWLKKILQEKDFSKLCRQSNEWLMKKEKFFQSVE